jgi:hypothetical protein
MRARTGWFVGRTVNNQLTPWFGPSLQHGMIARIQSTHKWRSEWWLGPAPTAQIAPGAQKPAGPRSGSLIAGRQHRHLFVSMQGG